LFIRKFDFSLIGDRAARALDRVRPGVRLLGLLLLCLFLNGSSVNPACSFSSGVCQGQAVTITSANIINGDTVTVVLAAGPNTHVQLMGLVAQYIPGTMAFSQDFEIGVFQSGMFISCYASNINNVTVPTSGTSPGVVYGSCLGTNNGALFLPNSPVTVINDNGPATNGNGSLVVTPIYTVIRTQ
jgi:hypothetical protein